MFYPKVMNKALIGVHKDRYAQFLSTLQESGIIEITEIIEPKDGKQLFSRYRSDHQLLNRVIKNQLALDHLLEILEQFHHEDEGVISTWFTPPTDNRIERNGGDADTICRASEELHQKSSAVILQYSEYLSIQEKIDECSSIIRSLQLLKAFNIPIEDIRSTDFCDLHIGIVSLVEGEIETVIHRIESKIESEVIYEAKKTNEGYILGVITTIEHKDELGEALRTPLFIRISPLNLTGKPSDLLLVLEKQKQELNSHKEKCELILINLSNDHYIRVLAIREDITNLREQLEIEKRCGATDEVVFIEGWITTADINQLQIIISQSAQDEAFCEFREPNFGEIVPVRYDNPFWLKPFEFLTTMFAPPRYGEIDPTPFFAPAFMIFFGLMLGDAGYGVIILIIAWLLYRGIGHRNFETGQMCIVLMGCGVADIIFGTLQGGWFGDLLPRFFGITPPFIFIEPLRSPILFFQLALIIGTIHINLGIFLGFWQSFKRNRYKEAVFEHLIWYVIQPAAAVLLVQFFGWMTPPPWATMSASVLLIVTFGLLFLSHGPMGFFSITGFLGDWLSYVRILALALATGGIAMTINLLAQMIAAVHPFMLIPAILFLIAGQTFNLIIQALGSVIHALRLHYIEFFGKFYTGGGKLFSPFCAHRVYTMKENRER